MQPIDLQSEISSLQSQLNSLTEKFDVALAKDVKLIEAKKLFHEMRILQGQIDELHKNNSNGHSHSAI
jgi:peptidoglycan hydrolase CwlO-like protein